MNNDFDIIIIGAGIAGASVAARLAETHHVLLLEMEERPGYHSTGRSAAAFEPNYGPACIRALTRAARGHFDSINVLTPRETLFLAPESQMAAYQRLMASQKGMRDISIADARALMPLLQEGYATAAVLDPGTADIDVDVLHQGFLRQFKASGRNHCFAPSRQTPLRTMASGGCERPIMPSPHRSSSTQPAHGATVSQHWQA